MIHLLSPGDADQRTGGYRYNARIVAELRQRGVDVTVHELPGDWPWPADPDRRAAIERIRALDGGVLADGLLWTALAADVPAATVLVHSPLWREHGPEALGAEEAALARAARVVCTSRRIARDLRIERPLAVIEPGTDPAPPARRPGAGALLCVANVVPRKGHDVLVEALRRVPVPLSLRCAGGLRDPGFAERVQRAASDLPVTWLGSLDAAALDAELDRTDVVVSAARYEGYGMALAEALARGLPVVSPPAGVLDGRTGGHLLVPVDDPDALSDAVRRVLEEPGLADRLAAEARAVRLPTWAEQAERWIAALGGDR